DGMAEIAVDRAQEPEAELHRQRAIKAIDRAQLGSELGRRIGRQHRDQRIARRDVDEQEAHQRNADHDRDYINDASGDIGEHGLTFGYRPRIWLVMPGLDPGIHPSSKESLEEDGWPGQARP